jgi:DNA-binding response OmpR family regulator
MPTIFIIDNEVQRARILSEALNESGFHTLPMCSGDVALSVMRTIKPNLLIVGGADDKRVGARPLLDALRRDWSWRTMPVLFASLKNGPTYRRLRRTVGTGAVLLPEESSVAEVIEQVRWYTARAPMLRLAEWTAPVEQGDASDG